MSDATDLVDDLMNHSLCHDTLVNNAARELTRLRLENAALHEQAARNTAEIGRLERMVDTYREAFKDNLEER